MNGISVIICCYNSVDRLGETVSYLINQELINLKAWEIIIIDNASQDGTYAFANSLSKKYTNNEIKVYKEYNPGLSYARHCGILNSLYNKIIFCDDDNLLFKNYLEKSYNYFNDYPEYAAFGGQGVFHAKNLPEIIIKNQLIFAVGPQAKCSEEVTFSKGYLYGAGLCLRKEAYFLSKSRETLLPDRKGKNLSSGGDTELCFNFVLNGFKIAYFEDLQFYHAIPTERLNVNYIRNFIISSAKESYLLDGLQYKAKIHPKMFDTYYKRNWLVRIIKEIVFFPRINEVENLNLIFKVKKLRIVQLLKLNFKYDKSFK